MRYSKGMGKPTAIQDMLTNFTLEDKGGYITREFQDYGYRLALEMGEESKKGMYIKLAKTVDRAILERARSYVRDAPKVRSKGKLFMWAVKRLREKKPLQVDAGEKMEKRVKDLSRKR